MNRNLLFSLAFVLTVAACSVFAEKPPNSLISHVAQQQIVHDEKCNFREEKNIECLIFLEEGRGIIWLVLFDENKNGDMLITRVVAVHNGEENIVWCRHDVCT